MRDMLRVVVVKTNYNISNSIITSLKGKENTVAK